MTEATDVATAAADLTVDTSGTCCPIPVVEARKAVARLEIGQTMELIATDPGSRVDMVAWTANTGHELLASQADGGTYRFLIRRKR